VSFTKQPTWQREKEAAVFLVYIRRSNGRRRVLTPDVEAALHRR
jgi:hypothetical protein